MATTKDLLEMTPSDLLCIKTVHDEINKHGAISTERIMKITGLSARSVEFAAFWLIGLGIIENTPAQLWVIK